jgi:small subunit ribosomal protein S7
MRSNKLFKKHRILPDKKFNSLLVSKMINIFMLHGKKSVCENEIVYPALIKLKIYYLSKFSDIKENDEEIIEKILIKCLNNIAFHYVIKKYKFGGAVFKIPIQKKIDINDPLKYCQIKAIRVLSKILRNRGKKYRTINKNAFKGMKTSEKLFLELSNSLQKKSEIYKISREHEKIAILNKAFSHLIKYKKKKKFK